MKLLKHKNFMGLIYSVLVALPLFAVLGRVIYTQSNNNAYQSYYGDTINDYELSEIDNLVGYTTNDYVFFNNKQITDNGSFNIYVSNYHLLERGNLPNDSVNILNSHSTYRIYFNLDSNNLLYSEYYYLNDNNSYSWCINIRPSQYNYKCYFNLNSVVPISTSTTLIESFYLINFDNYSFLDNAFEYSLSTFVDENDFGKLNFFSWFYDLFLSNTSRNNLYIHFVNWYMNYALLVSLTFVLFLVLMWFVSFVRKLLENSQNMHLGGL